MMRLPNAIVPRWYLAARCTERRMGTLVALSASLRKKYQKEAAPERETHAKSCRKNMVQRKPSAM